MASLLPWPADAFAWDGMFLRQSFDAQGNLFWNNCKPEAQLPSTFYAVYGATQRLLGYIALSHLPKEPLIFISSSFVAREECFFREVQKGYYSVMAAEWKAAHLQDKKAAAWLSRKKKR